jgi:putative ABC transport system permease protein
VIRGLLLEALCLAIPGCLLGLAVSFAGTSIFRRAGSVLPRADEIHLDWRIVVFTLSLSLLTAVLFGLVPAIRSTRAEVAGMWAQTSRTQIGGRHGMQRVLVSAQVALAITLLVGSGLLIRSLARLGQVPLGFDSERVLAFHVSGSYGETNNLPQLAQRLNRMLETVAAIPGVRAASLSSGLPGGGPLLATQYHIAGQDTETEGRKVFADEDSVTPDFFRVLGVPIISGNTCRINLDRKAQPTVLISRSFADRYFPGQNPLGRFLRQGDFPAPLQIVGVAGDFHKHGYAHDPQPTVYWCGVPLNPFPEVLLKSSADPLLLSEVVRRRIRQIEPAHAVYDVQRLSDYVSSTLVERRFQIGLLGSFAATALLLAAIGLYGVTSFLVSQRTREIGLRAALGATPSRIFAQVLREGALMTAAGVAFGLVAALVLTRYIASFLFGVAPTDPITFAAVSVLLACVSAAALWLPARRATHIDPMEALRQD